MFDAHGSYLESDADRLAIDRECLDLGLTARHLARCARSLHDCDVQQNSCFNPLLQSIRGAWPQPLTARSMEDA